MGNLAYEFVSDVPKRRIEIIDGKQYMQATPSTQHNDVVMNIGAMFKNYLKGKPCKVHSEHKVVFSENDKVIPDIMVVCDLAKRRENHIEGAPDLIIEVLSPSTSARDKGEKKRMYEKFGVKEYWIVNPASRTVEVYLLDSNRLEIDSVYAVIADWELEDLDEAEKNKFKYEFTPSMFSDLVIHVNDVFDGLVESWN